MKKEKTGIRNRVESTTGDFGKCLKEQNESYLEAE